MHPLSRQGTLEAHRGGWHCERGRCTLIHQRAGEAAPTTERFPFSGLEGQIANFLSLLQQEQQQAAGAGGGSAGGTAKGEGERAQRAYRVSVHEAARDLALVEALLLSSQQGGQLVPVARVGD